MREREQQHTYLAGAPPQLFLWPTVPDLIIIPCGLIAFSCITRNAGCKSLPHSDLHLSIGFGT